MTRTVSTPSHPPARSGVGLLAAALALAVCGAALLTIDAAPHKGRLRPASTSHPPTGAPAGSSGGGSVRPSALPSEAARPPDSTGADAPGLSEMPALGDGPNGDQAVQKVLAASWPADLPAALERQLVAVGTQVWRAEITGRGRERWPAYFSQTDPPRRVYSRFRIQAAIARRAAAGRIRVVLVWAATEPTGEHRDGHSDQVVLAKNKENGKWGPVR